MNDTLSSLVLVTGAGSYIGLHCVLQLLEQGYGVRGTLRSLDRQAHLRKILERHVDANDRLEFCEADLLSDAGWDQAVQGCSCVLHVASPFPVAAPKDENELILPAREGTRRVLRAAAAAGVRRVVLTSSMAAVNAGHNSNRRTYSENDWANVEGDINAYSKSKALAEKAAWDFIAGLPAGQKMELAAINPSLVMGPVLDEQYRGTSGILVRGLLGRKYPGCVDISFSMVDVRDVAAAHLKAMQIPEAAGQRFCCVAGELWMQEIAQILDRHYSSRGYPVRTLKLPNAAMHLMALFDPGARATKRELGRINHADTRKIRQVLGWQPRPLEESLVDMAESMIALKMV
jgi:dihydroflavonol-4-reductase